MEEKKGRVREKQALERIEYDALLFGLFSRLKATVGSSLYIPCSKVGTFLIHRL